MAFGFSQMTSANSARLPDRKILEKDPFATFYAPAPFARVMAVKKGRAARPDLKL